ncbi:lysophospholipid acyltransferase family protein [Silvanigrella sp.]|jgi:KDO2-lipid IV(A) lauroyltransferase|uniref:lysophospholipid acyltransferase family protein n=1 Tax=Silvanigrella sp. TaxID=2024976 RepID=UPI0037CB7F64
MIINGLLNILSFFLNILGHRGIYIISLLLGILSFDILRIRRKVILKNLTIAFGETKTKSEKIIIGRKSTISFLQTAIELFTAKKLFERTKIIIKNEDYFYNALAKNKGAYAICIHMGNWEYQCHVGSIKYAPIHVVVKAIGKGTLAKWVENMRASIGFRLIDRKGKESTTSQIFQALNKKEIIGFIVDQKRPRGEMLPFFGKEASTNNSLSKLWMRQNAPVVPVCIKRIKLDTHEMTFFPEFEMIIDKEKTIQENITENTRRMNLIVEEMVKLNPEEYFWMHNRWG